MLKLWDEVISDFSAHPSLLNQNFTSDYPKFEDYDTRLLYDSLCYKTWGLFRQINDKNLDGRDSQFLSICQWIVAHYYHWLRYNPVFFPDDSFWVKVDQLQNLPVEILRTMPLPRLSKNGEFDADGRYGKSIDWNKIAKNYHKYILGPFAPEMLEGVEHAQSRNLLMNVINKLSDTDFQELEILDLGCGPGNFLKALKKYPKSITGVDLSDDALRISSEIAKELNINFIPIKMDLRELKLERKFDIVVSINSILPNNRQEVVDILRCIRETLKPSGSFYGILPSFDATEHLRGLWYEHYKKMFNSKKHADRCVEQLDTHKLVDRNCLLYADDGCNRQAFHTSESICEEFTKAGLLISGKPQKIYYPWELTRRFDYGYFPLAKEEIWDWYVEAKKGNQ